jgi:hypothetical protein
MISSKTKAIFPFMLTLAFSALLFGGSDDGSQPGPVRFLPSLLRRP